MTNLALLQRQFIDFVYRHDKQIAEDIDGDSKEFALAIYRNNVRSNLIGALKNLYPSVYHLLGEEEFIKLSLLYVAKYVSCDGNLDAYGRLLADFITTFGQYDQRIVDLARLELAYNHAYKAVDFVKSTLDNTAEFIAANYQKIAFVLNPSLIMIELSHDLIDWWGSVRNLANYTEDAPHFPKRKSNVIVLRNFAKEIHYLEINDQERDFLRKIIEGKAFYQIFLEFVSSSQDNNLLAIVSKFINNDSIVKVIIEK